MCSANGLPETTLKTICLTRSGQEGYLKEELSIGQTLELRSKRIEVANIAPQVVELTHASHSDLLSTPLFFARQCLPNPQQINSDSISNWAKEILAMLIESFADTPPAWALQIFDLASIESDKQYARAARIEEAVTELMKQRRRSYLRKLLPKATRENTLVQVVLVNPHSGFFSISGGEIHKIYGSALAMTPAGYHQIADDKRPPSRAFKKLCEAIEVFSLKPRRGQTAVDLGASPGGWSYVLHKLGLTVTAIDRSPLSEPLMQTRGINWIASDALTWRPERSVDWLVCDVITTPENTLTMLKSWVSERLSLNFCITMKFKGTPAIETLLSLANFLRQNTKWFDGRQLTYNKNEVTIVGRL